MDFKSTIARVSRLEEHNNFYFEITIIGVLCPGKIYLFTSKKFSLFQSFYLKLPNTLLIVNNELLLVGERICQQILSLLS